MPTNGTNQFRLVGIFCLDLTLQKIPSTIHNGGIMSQLTTQVTGASAYTSFVAVAPIVNRQLSSRNGWRKQRLRTLVRDNFTCQEVGCTENRFRHLTVHHLVGRADGGTDNLDNLLTVCRGHHERLHSGCTIRLKSGEVCQ